MEALLVLSTPPGSPSEDVATEEPDFGRRVLDLTSARAGDLSSSLLFQIS